MHPAAQLLHQRPAVTATGPLLEAKNITLRFGGVVALSDVSIQVGHDELVARGGLYARLAAMQFGLAAGDQAPIQT